MRLSIVAGARFDPDIDERKLSRAQTAELGDRLVHQVDRCRVAGDALERRKRRRELVEDRREPADGQHQGIAVGEEYARSIRPDSGRRFDVGKHVRKRARPEHLRLVHRTESAAVERAADRRLDDQIAALAGRPVERFVVLQDRIGQHDAITCRVRVFWLLFCIRRQGMQERSFRRPDVFA
ncbi:MAG: hypothetical protein ACXWVR_10850 [Rhodoplanes sp.]